MDFISKLVLAFPSLTTQLSNNSSFGSSKKSFVQWFITEFMFCNIMVLKGVNPLSLNLPAEIKLEYKLRTDLTIIENSLITILNNLTGFNHLMSFNEQAVKHELRTKFVLESLQVLQKTIKTKKSINPLK